LCSIILILGLSDLPLLSSDSNLSHNFYLSDSTLIRLSGEAGIKNLITATASYFRSLDAFIVVCVLFTAVLAGMMCFGSMGFPGKEGYDSSILRTISYLIFPLAILFALYLCSYSLILPGGGVQGGTMIGACLIIIYLAWGGRSLEEKLPHFWQQSFLGLALLTCMLLFSSHWLRLIKYSAPAFKVLAVLTEFSTGIVIAMSISILCYLLLLED
jgi:multisubunit Na+/H+ antiporter MnhB subunit